MDAEHYTADPTGEIRAAPRQRARAPRGLPDDAELVARFAGRLRFFAAHRLGDAAEAEDVAQETLRRVLEALRSGRMTNPTALPAFVFQTARHICQQRHRSGQRQTRALSRLHSDNHGAQAPGMPDPLAALVSEERKRMVAAGLLRLAASDRELLRALYFADEDPNHVARALGITAAALRVRKHRALQRLALLLGEVEP